MFAQLKPYEDLNQIELPWLNRIPAGWRITRIKELLRTVDVRSADGSEELLTVSSGKGVVPRSSHTVSMFQAESYVGHKLCWPGDLVINSLWAWGRGLGVSSRHGIVSTAYGVYRPRLPASINPLFLHELVRSDPFNWELTYRSQGIWKSRLQMTDERFLAAPIPLPPAEEQAAIVKYLGHAHVRIDRAIAAKRKLIALLEEQKRATVHEVVTRGLNSNAPRAGSGVSWLGEIPAHWRVARAKELIREIDIRSRTGAEPLLSVSHLTGVTPRKTSVTMFKAATYVGHKLCAPGNLVVNTMWAWMGALGIAPEVGIVSPSYAVFELANPARISAKYVERLLTTRVYVDKIKSESTGIRPSRLRFYPDQLRALPLLVPPIEEQLSIESFIDTATATATKSQELVSQEIDLLQEFRTRLTSDVVTGQVDVREIAATLPELSDEEISDGDVDEFGDDDELLAEAAERTEGADD